MSRSTRATTTRTLSRKPSAMPSKRGALPSIQVQRNPAIIELVDRNKDIDYSSFSSQLQEAGATYTPSREDQRRFNRFSIYEMYFGGSPNYFDSDHYIPVVEKEQEFLNVLIRMPKVVEGITPCPKCRSTRVRKVTLRLRGGDEPDVNKMECARCNYNWSESK